jgi:capsule polysaccharide modification protein KpsS
MEKSRKPRGTSLVFVSNLHWRSYHKLDGIIKDVLSIVVDKEVPYVEVHVTRVFECQRP